MRHQASSASAGLKLGLWFGLNSCNIVSPNRESCICVLVN
ncbi:Uncharacterised protein [Vibrio cholerae]|nr:Uncharacterised protein [Vibrio cholerae]